MTEETKMIGLLQDIKTLLGHNKKVMNVEDLASYTGLSKSKIYKLTSLRLIPTGNNAHIRQKFFEKEAIDAWLLGKPDVSDAYLEEQFNEQLLKSKRI